METRCPRVGINAIGITRDDGGRYQYAVELTREVLLANRDQFRFVLFHSDPQFSLDVGVDEFDEQVVFVDDSPPDLVMNLALVFDRLCLGRIKARYTNLWMITELIQAILARLLGGAIRHSFALGRYTSLTTSDLDAILQPGDGMGACISMLPSVIVIHESPRRWGVEMLRLNSKHYLIKEALRLRGIGRLAKAVMTHSEESKSSLVRTGIERCKVHLLPLRAPKYVRRIPTESEFTQLQETYSLPEEYLFFPGGFHVAKNHEVMVKALHLLHQEYDLKLSAVFVGSKGPTLEPTLAMAAEFGLSSHVHYLGYVPDEDMAGLYKLATVLVSAWLGGPVNLLVMEAMATGCPVICPEDRGSGGELGDAALFVDARDPQSVARAIAQVQLDKEVRKKLIRSGAECFERLHHSDHGQRTLNVLSGVLQQLQSKSTKGIKLDSCR